MKLILECSRRALAYEHDVSPYRKEIRFRFNGLLGYFNPKAGPGEGPSIALEKWSGLATKGASSSGRSNHFWTADLRHLVRRRVAVVRVERIAGIHLNLRVLDQSIMLRPP